VPVSDSKETSASTLLQRAYSAFNARDLDGALATMSPDVVWPNGMEGGVVHGHDGVRAYWSRQWGMVDPHVDPVSFTEDESSSTCIRLCAIYPAKCSWTGWSSTSTP